MTVINTNVSAGMAANAIARNDRVMGTAMERLSTGKRVNPAADDAAGLAISSRMASQVKGLEMAARNANDGISMIQTVEGAAKEILNIMSRMKELAVQGASGTYSDTDRDALDLEFQALRAEITRVQANTTWNGMKLMDDDDGDGTAGESKSVSLQIGDSSGQTLALTFKDWSLEETSDATTTTAYGDTKTSSNADADQAMSGIDLQSAATADKAISALDLAITNASAEIATYGAYINRLEHASDNLTNVAQNTDASRSRIEDADYAAETSNLAKTQIIAQAGTAMLAQANQIKQTVLALLR